MKPEAEIKESEVRETMPRKRRGGNGGCQWEVAVRSRGAKFSASDSVLGGATGAEEPYGDSLHWAKFEDKELLISNKAEYLSVMK